MTRVSRIALRVALSIAIIAVATSSVSAEPTSRPTQRPTTKTPWAPRTDCTGIYGLPVKTRLRTVELAELMRDPASFAADRLEIRGVVQDVCRKKGCWLLLKSGKHVMRVRFVRYSFFVPTNSKGYGVTVYGRAKVTMIPERLARHYAEESGDPQKAKTIKGPQKTVVFTADWVSLYKLPKR
ncbi:MAG: DUF4920 domain-containing protein [Myxococcales bacterium]|nr:DUF4920 domain-containing protein [Myxococcales bacterium]